MSAASQLVNEVFDALEAAANARTVEHIRHILTTYAPTDPTRQRIEALLDTARQRRDAAKEQGR